MAASSKNTRMQSRLEKAARENHNLSVDYEVQAKIIREKTARLKALRLAKEAAEKKARALKLSAKGAICVKRFKMADSAAFQQTQQGKGE